MQVKYDSIFNKIDKNKSKKYIKLILNFMFLNNFVKKYFIW